MPVLGEPLSRGRRSMILLDLGKSQKIVPLGRPPFLLKLFLTVAAILVVSVAMRAIELQNEPFEGLYKPVPAQSEPNWDQLTE
jgi:hypothetical protein